jgi:hypothetical protein
MILDQTYASNLVSSLHLVWYGFKSDLSFIQKTINANDYVRLLQKKMVYFKGAMRFSVTHLFFNRTAHLLILLVLRLIGYVLLTPTNQMKHISLILTPTNQMKKKRVCT